MAYYDAVVTVMELFDDIIPHQPCPTSPFGKLPIINSLHEKFKLLEESLLDYSSNGDEADDHVEGLIRDSAYRAHDIIIESGISKQTNLGNDVETTSQWLESDLDTELKKVTQEIDLIVGKLVAIKERQRNKNLELNNDSTGIGASEQTPSGRSTMVGFVKDLTMIKDQLYGHSSKLQVISIVGTGGIGKTTLARNTFDDALVKHHFDYRAWVTVSQDYNVDNVIRNLLTSLGVKIDGEKENLVLPEDKLFEINREKENLDLAEEKLVEIDGERENLELPEEKLFEIDGKKKKPDSPGEKLYKFLKGYRYIAIIDDVWSTVVWNDLKRLFPDDHQGSRVMLTTRSMDIAQYASSSGFIHEMQFLDEEDSWTLFQEKVFGQNFCPPNLENIGRSIVSKCHGLPLAIVVIAGILSNVRLPQDWRVIETNMSSILSKTDERLFRIFSLSYNHLSHHQKACFLYMGSFPEDYEISVLNLIMLWIAEGFLKSTDESKSLEMVGYECLEDLVKRNLVLITKKRVDGKFKLCILHDILRDFCKQKAFHQRFSFEYCDSVTSHPRTIENAHRFSVHGGKSNIDYPFYHRKLVRSILWFGEYYAKDLDEITWDEHKPLRVWGEYGMSTGPMPDVIFEMFSLKYLQFSGGYSNKMLYLPPSIAALQNLQTLIICNKEKQRVSLPPEIWKLTKLRHVKIDSMTLTPMSMVGDTCVQKLGHLQTLTRVRNFKFTLEAIEMIPNLRKLKTCYTFSGLCDVDEAWKFHGLDNLVKLLQLEELEISFFGFIQSTYFPIGFSFPVNLTKLSLIKCGCPWEGMTAVGSLPNLQILKLEYSFLGDEWKPREGDFQSLKVLILKRLGITHWQAESCHFPCLEYLKIQHCYCLAEIPLDIGDIPTLKLIEVHDQSEEVEKSAMKIKEEQETLGNDMLQVRII